MIQLRADPPAAHYLDATKLSQTLSSRHARQYICQINSATSALLQPNANFLRPRHGRDRDRDLQSSLPHVAPSPLQHPCMLNTMSLLRRQLVVVPASLLLGFLVAYYSFKGALRQTAFGEPVHIGGGYNALGRIRPLNATEAAAVANEWGEEKGRKKEDEVVPDGMKVKDLAAAVENATLGVSWETMAEFALRR